MCSRDSETEQQWGPLRLWPRCPTRNWPGWAPSMQGGGVGDLPDSPATLHPVSCYTGASSPASHRGPCPLLAEEMGHLAQSLWAWDSLSLSLSVSLSFFLLQIFR